MAGGTDEDNPVPINVIPLVDIIFCLCIFFMCSFRFKQLEGKFDTWLPRDKGNTTPPTPDQLQEIRVALFWDEVAQKTIRKMGKREVETNEEMNELIRQGRQDFIRSGREKVPVTIDGDTRVPWHEVTDIIDICRKNEITEVEFAMGAPPPPGQ